MRATRVHGAAGVLIAHSRDSPRRKEPLLGSRIGRARILPGDALRRPFLLDKNPLSLEEGLLFRLQERIALLNAPGFLLEVDARLPSSLLLLLCCL